MTNGIGLDPDDVDRLAAELDARASEIEEIGGGIGARLASSVWSGPDHDRFHAEWESSLAPALAKAAEALRVAAQHASANAAEQRAASGAA